MNTPLDASIDVSVIIPCYNSEQYIRARVLEFEAVLKSTRWSWEILLADDGSKDQTENLGRRLEAESGARRFVRAAHNRGRGQNVQEAIKTSRGRFVGYVDVDYSTAAIYGIAAMTALMGEYHVAEAHRNYRINIFQLPFIFHRIITHVGYKVLVEKILGLAGHDTASGFKFFRREALLDIMAQTKTKDWFWDTEVIALAHSMGYQVAEIPTLFIRMPGMGSTVKIFKDTFKLMRALLKFRRDNRGIKFKCSCCVKRSYA